MINMSGARRRIMKSERYTNFIRARCPKCQEAIVKETAYMNWLGLMSLIEFLYEEQYIESETFETAMDRLMSLKCLLPEEE